MYVILVQHSFAFYFGQLVLDARKVGLQKCAHQPRAGSMSGIARVVELLLKFYDVRAVCEIIVRVVPI